LYVNLGGTIAGTIEASSPEVRWSGDDLYFWYDDEIRVWRDGVAETVARVDPDLIPRYPRDDSYFSADAKRFTVTRYHLDGTTERYIGFTATGEMTNLDALDATYTEWSPRGETLLVRSDDKLALIEPDGLKDSVPLSNLAGSVHGWTADGRLLLGAVSATIQHLALVSGASRKLRAASFVPSPARSASSCRAAIPGLISPRPSARSSSPRTMVWSMARAGSRSGGAGCACSTPKGSRAVTTTRPLRSCPSASASPAANPSRSSA